MDRISSNKTKAHSLRHKIMKLAKRREERRTKNERDIGVNSIKFMDI